MVVTATLEGVYEYMLCVHTNHTIFMQSVTVGKEMVYVYYGDTNERQGSELYMVKKEEGKEKQQLTGPEPATSRSIADPLAAEPWPLPATINPFPP